MAETQSDSGGSSKTAALHRAAAAAKSAALLTGWVLAYPFSLVYRVVANATSSAVPVVLVALIAWGARELYDRAVDTIDSETFNLFLPPSAWWAGP